MSVIKKILLSGIAAVLFLSCFLPLHAFAAGSSGVAVVSKLEMVIKYATLKTGQSRILNVTVSPGKADDKSVTWSSGDVSVATVTPSAGGHSATVTAVGEGKTRITATSANGKTAVCNITVSDDKVEVKKIEMIAEAVTIKVNQLKTLSVDFSPRNADDKSIIWDSSNLDVATVDDDGVVTGISPGTAEISATSGNDKTAVCTVTVTSKAVTETGRQAQDANLLITDANTSMSANISMAAGKERDLSGNIKYRQLYKDGNGVWITEWKLVGEVIWASSNPDVVSVSSKGVAAARRAGVSRITATARDESGRKHVQVIVVGVSSKTGGSAENSFEISEGVRLDLSQIGKLNSGTNDVTWMSSAPDIASVDSSGLALARSIGRCTVTASYIDESGAEASIPYQLRVTAAMLGNKTKNSAIVLKPGDKINWGEMFYPNYQALPNALSQYYCTTGSKKVLSADGLYVSAKAAGTSSVLIRQRDGGVCHKLTIVVEK